MKYTMKLSRLFQSHGQFCASHPWEVIVGTIVLMTSVVSMSAISNVDKMCGWSSSCQSVQDVQSSDVLILTITRCIVVIYIYLQFRNLRKLGSKYLLGITGIFTMFSSFVFSIAVINLARGDLTGLNEALPFFLLLVDLPKACGLAKYVLHSKNQAELVDNIGYGMYDLGPAVTLDTLVEVLVIGIGTLSGVRTLETMCCFGCLTVTANFCAFMTFYPACLAITFELLRGNTNYSAVKQLQQIKMLFEENDKKEQKNPVRQRVKLIMSAGLMVFHTMSRMVVDGEGEMDSPVSTDVVGTHQLGDGESVMQDMSYWQYVIHKTFGGDLDYSLPALLTLILTVKYILFDDSTDKKNQQPIMYSPLEERKVEETQVKALNYDGIGLKESQDTVAAVTGELQSKATTEQTDTCTDDVNLAAFSQRKKSVSFLVGTDSESEEETDMTTRDYQVTHAATQTEEVVTDRETQRPTPTGPRPLNECLQVMKSDEGPSALTDTEIMQLVHSKHIPAYKLETMLGDHERGVLIRRNLISETLGSEEALYSLPYQHYDYKYVEGACCENVVGYMPVPVGIAGPLLLNGEKYQIPMATTEGCLVASTNRGCRALSLSGGAQSYILKDGMSRAPVVRFTNAGEASKCKAWLEDPVNFAVVLEAFESTSRFAKLLKLHVVQAARCLYIRFVSKTGDAMGMNMISKGCEKALKKVQEAFPEMEVLSLSGNFCTDKKPSAVNWLEGRGKSVVCEAVIPGSVVKTTLKTSVSALVELNINKNLMGSAMAGSIGGFNAHAANIVTAIFIATGQDPAQNVCSSNCLTVMEATGGEGEDLYLSCTMPSLEVGTLGGGTNLPPQAACLQMLGVKGSHSDIPGENACKLAEIICAAVMAGELSLMSALAAGHLVRSHLKHNRSSLNVGNNSSTSSNLGSAEITKTTNCAEKLA